MLETIALLPGEATAKIDRSVFINCPYDSNYKPMFQTMIFGLMDFGFHPRSALELETGISSRFEKICDIIKCCKYGVHDISRVSVNETSGLPQFNMPFELGLFLGASKFELELMPDRDCLIVGGREGEHLRSISDLAGHDVQFHEYDHLRLLSAIRSFLSSRTYDVLPGESYVLDRRMAFDQQLPEMLKHKKLALSEMKYLDFCRFAEGWLKNFQEFKATQPSQTCRAATNPELLSNASSPRGQFLPNSAHRKRP